MAACLVMAGCNKYSDSELDGMTGTLVSFVPRGVEAGQGATKVVTPVESLDATGFYASAVTGTPGSDVQAWTNVSFTKSGDDFVGGKYWPSSNPSYRFYASNNALTYTSAGATVSATNTKDVVCAYKNSPVYGARNTLNFDHIFARISTVTVNASAPTNISNVTIWIVNAKTGGTYNLRTGAGQIDGTGWSSLTPAGDADTQIYRNAGTISSGGSNTGSNNDLYLVPGTYSLKATWTASVGEYSEDFTTMSSTSTAFIEGGKVNSLSCSLSGDAEQITFNVSVTDWSYNDIAMGTYPYESIQLEIFGGLNIAPANLYYSSGNGFEIKDDDWNHDSYNSVYGTVDGSYYFNFLQLGKYFDSRGNSFSESSGDINNTNKVSYGGFDDWRMPTRAEWLTLTTGQSPGTSRAGSTVNGNAGAKYVLIQLTGVTHAGSSTPYGLLIFPDGKIITGKVLSGINSTYGTSGVTNSELQNYLDQGCVFLPCSSKYDTSGGWEWGGSCGYYWSATQESTYYGRVLCFQSGINEISSQMKGNKYYPVRLVRNAE